VFFFGMAGLDADSALFPRLIGVPAVGFALVSLAVQTLPPPLAALRHAEGDRIGLRRLAVGIALPVAYLALWTPLGFQLDTLAFLVVSPMLLGFRRPLVLVGVAAVTTALFVFLFHLGSGAILPDGILHVGSP
jgi:hypothetical protein